MPLDDRSCNVNQVGCPRVCWEWENGRVSFLEATTGQL